MILGKEGKYSSVEEITPILGGEGYETQSWEMAEGSILKGRMTKSTKLR